MIGLKFTVSGEETIYQDINGEMQGIYRATTDSLSDVGAQMIPSLQRHIRQDWYLPWGSPKEYLRRTDMGIPGALDDPDYMELTHQGLSLTFSYNPQGNRYWPGHNADGDDLIEIIQTNSGWHFKPSKDTRGRKIMPRPFWNNFVDEQENSGIINAFIAGMHTRGYEVKAEGGQKDVAFQGNEGRLKG